MRDMNPLQHPMEHPSFNPETREPVWYLSHPLAADSQFNFTENVQDAKHMMRICFDEGFRVIAPYLSIIEVLDDDNLEHRRIGLETDCRVAFLLGRIIMTGHKRSKGMQAELAAVERMITGWVGASGMGDRVREIIELNCIIDVVNYSEDAMREKLRRIKSARD